MSRTGLAVAMGLAAALATFGQNVISARAGLIHHVEGKVLLEMIRGEEREARPADRTLQARPPAGFTAVAAAASVEGL